MTTTYTTTTNPTHLDVILADLMSTYNDCLAAADKATDSTYRHYWQVEARRWADRIARHIASR